MFNNKKGVATVFIFILVALSLIVLFFLLTKVDIPFFTFDNRLVAGVSYWVYVALWVLIQAVFVVSLYQLVINTNQIVSRVKGRISRWSMRIRNFIITRV